MKDAAAASPAADDRGTLAREPGSFRDRNGSVHYRDGRVLRSLSPRAFENWQRLQRTTFFARRVEAGDIVTTTDAGPLPGGWGLVEHARIPFVSYPYEWPFGMLKDAALLHLGLMRDALAEGFILKDSSPYNVQWLGARPVFIDIPSFEPLGPGEPWVGYRQFCELMLYPLMLQAYRGIDYRPLLRGRIDGIPAEEMRRLVSSRDLLRSRRAAARRGAEPAAAALFRQRRQRPRRAGQRRLRQGADREERRQADAAGPRPEAARRPDRMGRLRPDPLLRRRRARGQGRLRPPRRRDPALAARLGPRLQHRHLLADRRAARRPGRGDGRRLDGDRTALRPRARGRPPRRILPLVVNLADASPSQGWRGVERKDLASRGAPDLVLCLALVHHVVITANIPLADFIDWLASLGTAVVIEYVGRDDEMVQALLANREDQYDDYTLESFRSLLADRFTLRDEAPLKGGKRTIFFAVPRG